MRAASCRVRGFVSSVGHAGKFHKEVMRGLNNMLDQLRKEIAVIRVAFGNIISHNVGSLGSIALMKIVVKLFYFQVFKPRHWTAC